MKREKLLLAMLATANGQTFEPVHVQKAMFLLARAHEGLFDDDSRYNFTPYDYGPFDSQVYVDAEYLHNEGLASIQSAPDYGFKFYGATPKGLVTGTRILEDLGQEAAAIIRRISTSVRSCTLR